MFKIQKINPSSQLESKTTRITKLPLVNINVQSMFTLNYEIDAMLQIIECFFLEEHKDKNMVLKTLKILSVSLGDPKLVTKLQSILANHVKKSQQMYLLFSLWTSLHQNIQTILSKISPKVRKQLILTLFAFYLLKNNNLEEGIKKSLSKLSTLIDSDSLINELKKRYNDWGQPLKSSISKCMTIQTQNIALKQLMIKWIQYMLQFSENKVLELVQNIDNNKQIMDYLILNVPKMSSNFIRHIKKIINENNVMKMGSTNIKINSIFRSAVQEWVNQSHNFWKVIDQHYGTDNFPEKAEILKLGKLLNKQFQLSQSLTVKYLYHYFQSQCIEFDKEDRLVASQPHQSWMDVYRSIYQCVSYRQLNLIVINVNSAPKIWKQQNPFKLAVKNKPLQKFINKFTDFYDQKLKEYGQKNKKIELVFSTFLLYLKDRGSYLTVTFQQLKSYAEQGKLIDNASFREVYQPFVEEPAKPKQEIRKQHNIIIEAKLVKLLKRNKQCLTLDSIIQQSTYSQQIVELALKRLINKGLAEVDEKNKDAYIYVP